MQEKITTKVNTQLNNLYVLGLFVLFSLFLLGSYLISTTIKHESVTVSGRSSAQVANQIATFTVTVESNNDDKQTVVDEVTARAQDIVTAIKAFGIPAKDLETVNLNVYQSQDPVLEKGVTVYRPGKWYASYGVTVTLRDLTKSDALTSLLASFDKSSMWGPSLSVDTKSIDEAGLLQSAIDDSRMKADAIALKVGKKVGGTLSIIESNGYTSPITYLKDAAGMGGGGGMPIEPGSTTTEKYVTVTYWLK